MKEQRNLASGGLNFGSGGRKGSKQEIKGIFARLCRRRSGTPSGNFSDSTKSSLLEVRPGSCANPKEAFGGPEKDPFKGTGVKVLSWNSAVQK